MGLMDKLSITETEELKKQKRLNVTRKYLFIFSIIGVQLVIFIIFYVIQNFSAILMAFQLKKKVPGTADYTTYWTFANFTRFFNALFGESVDKTEIYTALTNTMRFFLVSMLMFPISFVTSYFMYKKVYGSGFFRIVFFFPSVLSAVVWSMLFKEIVGPQGPIVQMYMFLHNTDEPILLLADPKYAIHTVVAYSIWLGIAGNFILYGGALARIPTEVIEAGQLDGIGWFTEMVKIIIPLILPTMGTLILLQLVGLFTSSGNILLLTGGAFETTTISYFIFANVYKQPLTSNTYNYAAAVGLVFTALTLPIVFFTRAMLNKIEDVQY